jgi:hypothetical protein
VRKGFFAVPKLYLSSLSCVLDSPDTGKVILRPEKGMLHTRSDKKHMSYT